VGERRYLLKEDDIIIINSNSAYDTLSKESACMAMVFHLDTVYLKEYLVEYESLRFEGSIRSSNYNNEMHKIIRYLLASLLVELKKGSAES
jgi:hypothetical protein